MLPADVIITPVSQLDAETRRRLAANPSECLVSRPGSRRGSIVVDAAAAAFLALLREPKTVIEAVIDYCRAIDADPEVLLDESLPLLSRLLKLRLLVPASSAESGRREPTLRSGAWVADLAIVDCVHLFEDVELYRARGRDAVTVAVKLLRSGAARRSVAMLHRETEILALLGGVNAPRLLSHGEHAGRPYLVESWVSGTGLADAAASARDTSAARGPAELVKLCGDVLSAYTSLHQRGVVHADVHPGNVIVRDDGKVVLVDFGLAVSTAGGESAVRPPRGAVPYYLDPEHRKALIDDVPPPPADERGEQFALAALCFFLITGQHYVDFRLDRQEWLHQVVQARPRSFRECGSLPWAAVESVLAKALSIDPDHRFASVAEFAHSFGEAAAEQSQRTVRPPSRLDETASDLTESLLRRYDRNGEVAASGALLAPRCSVTYGASGLAYFFYRAACLRNDADLLSTADFWARWSLQRITQPDALHEPHINITKEVVGDISLYHSATGAWCVQALVSFALGDVAGVRRAVRGFVAAADAPYENLDLTLGGAGLLHGCVLLLEAFGDHPEIPTNALRELGDRTARRLVAHVAETPSTNRDGAPSKWLGIAHGWAGMLFALLRWSAAAPDRFPADQQGPGAAHILECLRWLRDLARPVDGGLCWPQRLGLDPRDQQTWTGWCHGSAGYISLWLEAHSRYPAEDFDELAVAAGDHVWACVGHRSDPGTLCCGSAGQSYALLALYNHVGEERWLDRSGVLGRRAADLVGHARQRPGSLYKGDVGVGLLAEELRCPSHGAMPLFGAEGWPGTS